MASGNNVLLNLRDVRVEFLSTGTEDRSVVALDGVSLVLHKGEHIHLSGPNGSGKSTLLKLISGLVSSTGGEVVCQGRIVDPDKIPRLCSIVMVYQALEEAIVPMMSIGDHLAFRLSRRRHQQLSFRMAREQARMYLQSRPMLQPLLLRFDDEAEGLSGGWKQLLQIVTAACCRPTLALLDEPTSHLSQDMTALADDLLANDMSESAFIYVSHAPPTNLMNDNITTLWRMDHGKLSAFAR